MHDTRVPLALGCILRTESHYFFFSLSRLNVKWAYYQKHEDFCVAPSCGNLTHHQNKAPPPLQTCSQGAGPPGPTSPSSLSVHVMLPVLLKELQPAAPHRHILSLCTAFCCLMPSFPLMLVTSIPHLVNTDLSSPVKPLLVPPHTPSYSFIICLLPASLH